MPATSQDVADRAGVSRSTVSQILNGRSSLFAEETRARVAEAVRALGYQPSAAGRALARGSSDIVIALIPNTTFGGNLQDVYELLTVELEERGLTLVLRLSTTGTESLDRLVVGLKPRAVLTLTQLSTDQRDVLERRGVELLEPATSPETDTNARIGSLQARFLIGRGHRRLAYAHLRDARDDPFGRPRELAFLDECRAHRVPDPEVLYLGITPDEGRAALDQLHAPGVAVGCYNDDVAAALLFAAAERKWRVPDDLALIGMDNSPVSHVTVPPLTTMAYAITEVTAATTRALLARLDNDRGPETPIDLQLQLIERGST